MELAFKSGSDKLYENVCSPLCQVLPITLVYFKPSIENDLVNVIWITASEMQVQKYEIQTSRDGNQWNTSYTCLVNGDSYKLLSRNTKLLLSPGKWFIRLKETDYNGYESFFETAIVDVQPKTIDYNIPWYYKYDILGRELN